MKISKKISSLLIMTIVSISLFGCSKTDTKDQTNSNIQKESNYSKGEVYKIDGIKSEDEGITQVIEEVGVFSNMTDAAHTYKVCNDFINDKNKGKATVIVKYKIKNNNDFSVDAYASTRPFVTNTGEKVDLIESTYNPTIKAGETTENYTIFNLTKTKPEDLNNLKMWWIVAHSYGASDDQEVIDKTYAKDNKFEITLDK